MVREASDENEFLERMIQYATTRSELRDTNDRAKQIYEDYESQLPKDQQSLDDDN